MMTEKRACSQSAPVADQQTRRNGDEGPDLHGLRKTDARLSVLINNGIKGEMPRFNQKLSESDVQALIAFLNSLR